METKLSKEEAQVLSWVLSKLTVKDRTGEIGIMHGAERFVSTHLCLKKNERAALNSVAAKFGNRRWIKGSLIISEFELTSFPGLFEVSIYRIHQAKNPDQR